VREQKMDKFLKNLLVAVVKEVANALVDEIKKRK
jgi:hypothetical protein